MLVSLLTVFSCVCMINAIVLPQCMPCDLKGLKHPTPIPCCVNAAATNTWTGSCGSNITYDNYNTASCWSAGAAPKATDVISFSSSTTINTTMPAPLGQYGNQSVAIVVQGIVVPAGVTLVLQNGVLEFSASLVIQGTLEIVAPDGLGTKNSDQFYPDPKAQGYNMRDCNYIPGGFSPRLCGTGVVTVQSGGTLDVRSSIFAAVQVQAGGQVIFQTTYSGSFFWNYLTNWGSVSIFNNFYLHGTLHNMAGGVLSAKGNVYYDEYNYFYLNQPENINVPAIINEKGANCTLTGGWLVSTIWQYADKKWGTYLGVLENNGGYVDIEDTNIEWIIHNNPGGVVTLTNSTLSSTLRNHGTVVISKGEGVYGWTRLEKKGTLINDGPQSHVTVQGVGVVHFRGKIHNSNGATMTLNNVVVFLDNEFLNDASKIVLQQGSQLNFHGTSGIYCWESCWKYCGSNCGGDNCPCAGDGECSQKAIVDNVEETYGTPTRPVSKFQGWKLRQFKASELQFVMKASLSDVDQSRRAWVDGFHKVVVNTHTVASNHVSFQNGATISSPDGTGSVIATGPVKVSHTTNALTLENVNYFAVVEGKEPLFHGNGAVNVVGGLMSLGLDATLGHVAGGGSLSLNRGARLFIDHHAGVTVGGNYSLTIAEDAEWMVDGTVRVEGSLEGVNVCGRVVGGGIVEIPSEKLKKLCKANGKK